MIKVHIDPSALVEVLELLVKVEEKRKINTSNYVCMYNVPLNKPPEKMKNIEIGSVVVANRDLPNKNIAKGDTGTVTGITDIDSERYYRIELVGNYVDLSSENCWDLK